MEGCTIAVNKSISEALRESFSETLEDECDIMAADEAYAAFVKNPVSRSIDDVMRDYGL